MDADLDFRLSWNRQTYHTVGGHSSWLVFRYEPIGMPGTAHRDLERGSAVVRSVFRKTPSRRSYFTLKGFTPNQPTIWH